MSTSITWPEPNGSCHMSGENTKGLNDFSIWIARRMVVGSSHDRQMARTAPVVAHSEVAPSMCVTQASWQIVIDTLFDTFTVALPCIHTNCPVMQRRFDHAEALYFATYGGALTIKANSDAWSRMRRSGAATVSCTNDGL